jgi:hypothetical protein
MTSALDPEQRAGLYRAKLRALVASHLGPEAAPAPRRLLPFGGGAGLLDGDAAWVLIESPSFGLGSAMAWAEQQGARQLHVIASGDATAKAGTLARQSAHFAEPPMVWSVAGTSLVAAGAAPVPEPVVPPAVALELAEQIRDAGLDVVVEHGVVCGEVFGLEVARVVVDDDRSAHIEVGVGPNDREAFGMLHGDLSTPAALKTVADAVLAERRPGRPSHPLNRIAAERWLRAQLIADPGRFAGWALVPVPGVEPRASLNDRLPAFAVGHDDRGGAVVVAFSVGIDLDLVPVAADTRAALDPDARLVLAVPARDAHPVTRRLAGALRAPAEVVPVDGEWR